MDFNGVVLIAGGCSVALIALLGREERLPRNRWAGIRMPSTRRSDKAWKAAHKAAWPYLMLMGAAMVLYGIRLKTAHDESVNEAWIFIGVAALASVVSIVVARRAALAAENTPPDNHDVYGRTS